MNRQTKESPLIYWEAQQSDNLCGLHCLNNVLQAPIYDEVSLSEVAMELERAEARITGKMEYNNVGLDGNFNVQVISRATELATGCRLVSTQSQEMKGRNLQNEQAFICNHSHHWIGIRKLHGTWYNLNSTNSDGPQIISDFYLTVLLDSILQNGYTIFAVHGQMPHYDPGMFKGTCKPTQFFFTVDQIAKTNEKRNREKNNEINLSGYDKREMKKMLEAARKKEAQEFGYDYQGEDGDGPGQSDKKAAPEKKYFEGQGTTFGGSQAAGKSKSVWYEEDPSDADTIACIKMSLQDAFRSPPAAAPGLVTVRFRYPDGRQLMWRFHKSASVRELYQCVFSQAASNNVAFVISKAYPKKDLVNADLSLADEGIEDMEGLNIVGL